MGKLEYFTILEAELGHRLVLGSKLVSKGRVGIG